MSLKAFHFVFILASITLSAWMGAWGVSEFKETHETVPLVMAALGIFGGIGLVFYLGWFLKKLRGIGFLLLLLTLGQLMASQDAFGCAVCIGNPNSPMVKASITGIWVLLGVITTVLAGFASLFGIWILRAYGYLPSGLNQPNA